MLNVFLGAAALAGLLNALLFGGGTVLSFAAGALAAALLVFRLIKKAGTPRFRMAVSILGCAGVAALGLLAGLRVQDGGLMAYGAALDKAYAALEEGDGYKTDDVLDALGDRYNSASSYLLTRARAALLRGDTDAARTFVSRLSSGRATLPGYYTLSADICLRQENYTGAQAVFIEAARRYPFWTDMQYCAGAQAVQNKNYATGDYFLMRALEQDDGATPLPLYFLGVSCYDQGDYEAAAGYFAQARAVCDDDGLNGDIQWYLNAMEKEDGQ